MNKDDKERFWDKVDTGDESECWNWQAAINSDGYGQIYFKVEEIAEDESERYGRMFRAHRISWKINEGEIPDGKKVLHTCDNKKCVNPNHLYIGTAKDNSDDREERLEMNHPKGEDHECSKLSRGDVVEIKQTLESGEYESLREIAEGYPVSSTTISLIKRGEKWSHVQTGVEA